MQAANPLWGAPRIHGELQKLGIEIAQATRGARRECAGAGVPDRDVLLYPSQGEKGPCRTATVLTKHSLPQQLLATTLGLDRLGITPRR